MTQPILSSRRSFVTGLVSLIAAPAIVRAGSLMPVKAIIEPVYGVNPSAAAIEAIKALQQMQWEINYDYAMGQIIKVMGVPSHYLRAQ